jgi:hypothetical protein
MEPKVLLFERDKKLRRPLPQTPFYFKSQKFGLAFLLTSTNEKG